MAQTENRRVNIYINTDEAQKSQDKLLEKSKKLKSQIDELTEGTEAYQNRLKKFQDAEKQLKDLEEEANKLTSEMSSLNQESEEYIQKSKRLDDVYVKINKTAQAVNRLKIDTSELAKKQEELAKTSTEYDRLGDKINGKVAPSLREMRNSVSALRRELEGLPVGTQAFIDKTKQLQEAEKGLRNVETSVKDTRTALQKLKADFSQFGAMAGGLIAGELIIGAWQAVIGFMGDAITKQKELSYKIFDMQKFLGLSAQEAAKLNSELSKIKSVTPTGELREMAIAAGKLGVPTAQVKGFVTQMDIAQQALAGEFNSTAEETSVKLGKLKGQFEELKTQSWEVSLAKISSTLLEAGASGAASAENLTEFGLRMGALGKLGPSFVQNMAVGAVLEEAGLSADIASGGLSNLFIQSGKESAKFAAQMGMSKQALENLINTSPYDFLKELAKSFQGLDNDQVIAGLTRLGVGSNESVKVLSILRDKLDDVEQKNISFGKTFDEGTKGQNLAAERMKTFGAQVDAANKEINAFVASIQSGFVPIMTGALTAILFIINAIKELPKFLKDNEYSFYALGVAVFGWNLQQIKAEALMIKNIAALKMQEIWTNRAAIATRTITGVKETWTKVQKALNMALRANPIGIVITVIALLAAGIIYAYQKSETFRGVLNGLWGTMKVLGEAFTNFYIGLTTFDVSKMVSAFSGIGEKLSKAYTDGFNSERDKALKDSFAGNEQKIRDQEAQKILAWKKKQGEGLANAEKDNQAKINQARAETLAKGDSEESKAKAEKLKKRMEEEAEAQENINKMKIALMRDGLEKQLLLIDEKAREEMAKVKGNAQQINEQWNLIQAQAQVDRQKLIISTVVKNTVTEQDTSEIDYANEQKNIDARYKYRTEAEKQAYLLKQQEIYALEDLSIAEREGLLQLNEETSQTSALEAEQFYLLSRMELLKQFGLEYSAEYQTLENNLLTNQIAQNKKKLTEEEKLRTAKLDMWTSFGSAFGQIQAGINQMGAEGTAFSKALAVAQIAIDTAVSIAKVMPLAIEAAGATGPAAPFALAGYIATMVGTVVGAFGSASKILSTVSVPAAPNSGGGKEANVGGYQDGGFTPSAGSDSKAVGVVHANEYVIPAPLLRANPIVANFARITESFRTGKGYETGGLVSQSATISQPSAISNQQINIESPELLAEVRAMRQDIVNLRSIIFRGYVVHKDIREMDDLTNELDSEIIV